MLMPIAQITCNPMMEKEMSNEKIRLIRKISTSISQEPLVIRKRLNSFFDLRLLCRNADIPERKTKTGAQKWVIHLVKYKMGVVVCMESGSSVQAGLCVKSRV